MKSLSEILDEVSGSELSFDEIKFLLSITSKSEMQKLFDAAYQVKVSNVGKTVFFRGIVEFSNICEKDCYYCGIRRSNDSMERYMMKEEEILDAAKWAMDNRYGSIVLQSGENTSPSFVDFIERLLKKIKKVSEGKLGITLSLGEQTKDAYRRWMHAGAHRYLLRIETSNEKLYRKLHPADHVFSERMKCLEYLRKLGYQVGTGVMIGLPYQTIDDLASDILFFRKIDADMIGMGPYIVHRDTPLAGSFPDFEKIKEYQLNLSLKMIAVTRLILKDVNIASTTALQSLNPTGREMGLLAGANIIMPNITDTKYRASYRLYDDKPCIDENSSMCKNCLERRIASIGESIGYDEWGDSMHFKKRHA